MTIKQTITYSANIAIQDFNFGYSVKKMAVSQPFINIETSFFHYFVYNDTGHQLQKFDTNLITHSKMTDKMATVEYYNWL